MKGPTLAYKYLVERRNVLGEGAFAMVMKGFDSTTSQSVAIKKARISSRTPRPTLEHEVRVMTLAKGHASLPIFFGYLRDEHFEYIAMELLGPPISEAMSTEAAVPPTATVVRIVQQMISALKHIHSLGIVHRDVKTYNICCSYDKTTPTVKLIDFGIAQCFSAGRKPRRCDPLEHGHTVVGTLEYASINAHLGIELLPRDDLESLAYTTFFMLRRALPWERDRRMYSTLREQEAIHKIKAACSGSALGQGYPAEFGSLLDYSRKLRFSEKPDYQSLAQSFTKLTARMGWSDSGPLDWTPCQPLNSGPIIPEPDVSHLPEEDPEPDLTAAGGSDSYRGADFMWWEKTNAARRTECTLPPPVCAALDANIPQISVEMIVTNPWELEPMF